MKKKIKLALLCTLFFFSCIQLWSVNQKKIERLDGEWDLYLEKNPFETIACVNQNIPADFKTLVPGYWNVHLQDGNQKGDPKTYGCYRYVCSGLNPSQKYAILVQDAPKTSCAVYVNRELLVSLGDPFHMVQEKYGNNKEENDLSSYSVIKPIYCEFYPDSNGNAELIFFITNYFYRKGGLCDSVMLGPVNDISRLNTTYLIFYTFVFGSLVFIGLLNIIQFLLNRKRLEYFYLAIATFMFALRIVTSGYCSLGIIIPQLTAEVKIKLEYMVLWLAPCAILQMVFAMYPPRTKRIWEPALRYVIITCVCAMGIVSLAVPARISNQMVPLFQVCMGIVCLYVIIVSLVNVFHHKRYSVYLIVGFLIVIAGAVVDILYTKNRTLLPLSFFPFFLVIYLLIQMFLIAVIQNDLYRQSIKKSDELKKLNEAYLRFVPQEFLTLLNKESVIKTKLGDYSNIEMCIMFSKIKIQCYDNDAALDEHFHIFSEYLKQVAPIIKKHNGFVSKFLSNGFMALFPKSELDAVGAAMEIKECVKSLNKTELCNNHKIEPWMGIHFGKMIIGTIGEENRMDDTVISDTVNTAARIESVCEKLGKNIIVSRALQELGAKDVRLQLAQRGIPLFHLHPLEAIYVKGKEKPLKLFEILERGGEK